MRQSTSNSDYQRARRLALAARKAHIESGGKLLSAEEISAEVSRSGAGVVRCRAGEAVCLYFTRHSFRFLKPLRPLTDRFSARLLKSELAPDDFQTEGDRCLLHDGRRGLVYRAWERLLAGSIGWRGESLSWRRLIHLQARELAHWLGGTTAAPRFWHLDDA
ncbi:hypothetical protein [Candidatus Accumulibacter vicinus]|uniref:Uncharacterized protein n=1 Tax=Candidatus Accumulibacter vicinus TaxID=2954382 RepID=A0A084XYU6_9PROT|nr:hypothetical protein [Candidatus Accumulibacter vicinus]KFB67640.1 MAG: hypothetical protein CAPSK01_003083 [Candidatus Accumulibacter vicinus]